MTLYLMSISLILDCCVFGINLAYPTIENVISRENN